MKIRGDFVTNSSSVSYILTMNEKTFDIMIQSCGQNGKSAFLNFVKNKIKSEGNKLNLEGTDIYSLKLTFNTDDAIPLSGMEYDGSNFNDCLNIIRELDITTLNDEELASFLYWTVLTPQYLPYIGTTRVKTY